MDVDSPLEHLMPQDGMIVVGVDEHKLETLPIDKWAKLTKLVASLIASFMEARKDEDKLEDPEFITGMVEKLQESIGQVLAVGLGMEESTVMNKITLLQTIHAAEVVYDLNFADTIPKVRAFLRKIREASESASTSPSPESVTGTDSQ